MKLWFIFCAAIPAFLHAGPPNILLIVTDDQRPDTIHALGNAVIETPTQDRLVARGTSFSRAYANYPICYVSRAQIITGCPSFHALARYPLAVINPKLATLAGTFQSAGYQTWYSGKWHNNGQPKDHGYMATRALYSSGGAGKADPQPAFDERGRPVTGYRGWTFKKDDGKVELEKGVGLGPDNSRYIADGAIQAIHDTPKGKPFLLHVNFAYPHDPRQWPTGMKDSYQPSQLSLPTNFAPDHPFDHGNRGGRDEVLLPIPRTPSDVREQLALYYAMITDMDKHLGRILEALKAAGQDENTIITFTSDQGLALGSHGLLGKQNQYEDSIRSPLIIVGPGLPAQRKSAALACLYDLFPTLCDLAAVPIPATVERRSLAPLLRGQTDHVHDFITGTFTDTQRMICDEHWKFISYPKAGREQLFDLQNDPDELHDLSTDDAHRAKRDELSQRLNQWSRENGDPLLK